MFTQGFKKVSQLMLVFAAAVYLLLGAMTGTAYADVNGSMDSFWNNSLSSTVASGPSAFQGQQYGYYTFGNLSYRTPQTNAQLGSLRLPSVKAGCGGIDIFGGGFSYINSDQLVAVMKNAASNAIGLLFEMAVDSLSEILGTNIKQFMTNLQNEVNKNIDSCHAAQMVISDIVHKTVSSSMNACMDNGIADGKYTDYAEAFAKCGAGGEAETMAAGGTDDQKAGQNVDHNLAWDSLMKHPLFKGDVELSETMMTLTGTIITSYQPTSSDPTTSPKFTVKLPSAISEGVISSLLDGGSLSVYDCGADTIKCLAIADNMKTVTIGASSALRPRVSAMLTSIVAAIKSRTALTDEQKNFVASAPIPIYRMASVSVANNATTAQADLDKYSDYIATLIVINWAKENTYQVLQASGNTIGVDAEQKAQWTHNVEVQMATLDKREAAVTQKLDTAENVLRNYQIIEAQLYANASSRLGQSLMFVNSMKHAGA